MPVRYELRHDEVIAPSVSELSLLRAEDPVYWYEGDAPESCRARIRRDVMIEGKRDKHFYEQRASDEMARHFLSADYDVRQEDRQHERPPAAVAPSVGPIPVT